MGKDEFVTDKLWKAARAIIDKDLPGTARLKHILKISSKPVHPEADGHGPKLARAEDMVLRVMGVMAAVGGKFPLSVFDNDYVKQYLRHLNPKHRVPHQLERNRVI